MLQRYLKALWRNRFVGFNITISNQSFQNLRTLPKEDPLLVYLICIWFSYKKHQCMTPLGQKAMKDFPICFSLHFVWESDGFAITKKKHKNFSIFSLYSTSLQRKLIYRETEKRKLKSLWIANVMGFFGFHRVALSLALFSIYFPVFRLIKIKQGENSLEISEWG